MVDGKIKLIVFDLDGTLADSKKVYIETIGGVLEKYGFHFSAKQIEDAMGPKLNATLLNLRKFDKKMLHDLKVEINLIIEDCAPRLKAAPYSAQVLKKLKNSGNYKIVLMTNSTHRFAHNFVHNAGIEEYFDQILGAEDFVDKETAFHTLFKELKVKPDETIYIGDKTSDYDRAKKVGCGLALSKAIAWDKHKFGEKKYRDFVISDLRGLFRVLK